MSTNDGSAGTGKMFVSAGEECPNCGEIVRRCGVLDFRPHPDDETTACVFRSESLKRWSADAVQYVYAYHQEENQPVQPGNNQSETE